MHVSACRQVRAGQNRANELTPLRYCAIIYLIQVSNAKKGGGGIKNFCFTVDDNIRFLKEITQNSYRSIFDHPYLAMFKRLHEDFELKIQLNLFERMEDFDLSRMSEAYYDEWKDNSDWLKLSFHSEMENVKPYEFSGYDEVYGDCRRVHEQIERFASPAALAKTTTIHYCLLTEDGLKAMADNSICGLLGLFGVSEKPRTSYGIVEGEAKRIRDGEILKICDISFASIDIVLNSLSTKEILKQLACMSQRNCIRVMIHEQYFYSDYIRYQPDFEEKLRLTFAFLCEHGYQSAFYESLI